MPLLWGTSLLCILLAHLLKLNQVALQSVNYLLYPIQLALLAPFFKLGAWLIPGGPPMPVNLLSSILHNPGFSSLHCIAWITLKSIAAWMITVLPVTLLICAILQIATFAASKRSVTT